ncbi:energy transducer TonB [Pseudotabrizicola alkalilacus]|uniref:TonB family protein n=1 Tax=Pseudotabrizicola alkalilacus TaxID=2305252 RepID=A0A411Z0W1_9RHOB|nr:TonB family protein [Pseudotabrizicola alkalilacus]RGP36715.1 TonB family protein [Pseudotabrizicola alkalilacus]
MKHARLPFVAALALSGALHAAGAIAIAPQHDALSIEGGGTATIALLGEAFEDLAQGAQPVEATGAAAAPPHSAQPVTAQAAPVAPAMADSPAPSLSLPVSDAADLTAAPPADPTPALAPEPAPPVVASLSPAAPTSTAQPVSPTQLATAVEAEGAAPETSPRPRARAERPEKRVAEKRTASPTGNADRNARKGAQSGQENAPATAAATGTAQGNRQAGNAARSNYPGLVLRKIERTRKPAHAARGTVVVAFRVAPSGALASARVARSTGDPSLERVALDHIRRAAPFPPPPAGAETDFRFEFVGRR